MEIDEKKYVSVCKYLGAIAILAFSVLGLCSIAILLAPSCMIAKMTGWSFWGISKDGWEGMSTFFGLLAVSTGAVYLLLHLGEVLSYIKNNRIIFPREWTIALIICGVLAVGVVAEVEPFSSFQQWHESHKHQLSNNQTLGQSCGAGMSSCSSQSLGGCGDQSCSSHAKPESHGCSGCDKKDGPQTELAASGGCGGHSSCSNQKNNSGGHACGKGCSSKNNKGSDAASVSTQEN